IISVFMGDMLTRLIENIAAGKAAGHGAEQELIKLGVNKLPEIEKDNTDRNRTSPFAFTGNKFEYRAVGSSQSIAFPIMILNATVAAAIDEITERIKAAKKKTKNIDDAVMVVVREVFRETKNVRFEGNNYAESWVKEAAKRGLPNYRRTPESLGQLITKQSRDLFEKLGILTKEELESRYHVRVERYVKDMLIESQTLIEIVDTMVLPAAFEYANKLADGAALAKSAGIKKVPQISAANDLGATISALQDARKELGAVTDKANHTHDDPEAAAKLLTTRGADTMANVRSLCDALELKVADDLWPLPKYREILFPV
ncbi:MAG: glutamine synthetase type III, partial [Gemmatimonadaceae bacterium]